MASIGDLFLKIKADDAQFRKDLTKNAESAGAKAGDVAGKSMAARIGAGLKKHATLIATGAGAALGTFAASSAQAFVKFESQMAEVFTLLPEISGDAMQKMEGQVKSFATEFGVLPDEVVPALYQALSAGVDKDNVFDFLETANKLAKGGVAETSEAVAVLATVTKGFGDTSEEANIRASDLLLTTVKLGTTTLPELAASIGKVIPIAAALGDTEQELLAATAALTGVTGNTAEVMTQLKATFNALVVNQPAMKKALQEIGFETGQAAHEALGFDGTLRALVDSVDGDTTALGKMFGSVEAVSAVLSLVGERADAFSEAAIEMGEAATSGGEVSEVAFERMDSTTQATIDKIQARLQVMMIDVGEMIKPVAPLLLAFGPTIGKALGGAFGAGFGFLATQIPRLMRGTITKIGAVLAASSVGSSLGAAITSHLGSSAMLAKLGTIGLTWGTVLGAAAAAALVAVIVAELIILKDVVDGIQKEARAIKDSETLIREDFFSIAELEDQLRALEKIRHDLKTTGFFKGVAGPAIFDAGLFGSPREQIERDERLIRESIERQQRMLAAGVVGTSAPLGGLAPFQSPQQMGELARIREFGKSLPQALGEGIEEGAQTVDLVSKFGAAFEGIGKTIGSFMEEIPRAIRIANKEAAHEARLLGPSLRDGIRSGMDAVKQAMSDLKFAMTHPLKTVKTIAKIEGVLTGKQLRQGLKSTNPDIRDEALRVQSILREEWSKLTGVAWEFGQDTTSNFAAGTNSRRERRKILRAARRNKRAALDPLSETPAKAQSWGESVAQSFAAGISAFISWVSDAAEALASEVRKPTKPGSPTETGPLSQDGGIETWGQRLAQDFAEGLSSSGFDAVAALGLDAFARNRSTAGPTVMGGAQAAGGGMNVNLQTFGLPTRARTPLEVAQQLKRATRLGVIEPTRTARFEVS